MDNFNLNKFLTENRLTKVSKILVAEQASSSIQVVSNETGETFITLTPISGKGTEITTASETKVVPLPMKRLINILEDSNAVQDPSNPSVYHADEFEENYETGEGTLPFITGFMDEVELYVSNKGNFYRNNPNSLRV